MKNTEELIVPTVADHTAAAVAAVEEAIANGPEVLRSHIASRRDALVERLVRMRAPERHAARVAYARQTCLETFATLRPVQAGEEDLAASAVAALALIGQGGGPDDMGGPKGSLRLPLLPSERIWKLEQSFSGAWCAALRKVQGSRELGVVATPTTVEFVVVRNCDCDGLGTMEVWPIWRFGEPTPHGEWRAAFQRLLLAVAKTDPVLSVTGEKRDIVFGRRASEDAPPVKCRPTEADRAAALALWLLLEFE
jgi:hypothetical protein